MTSRPADCAQGCGTDAFASWAFTKWGSADWLNASGRMETAEASLELLLAPDVESARRWRRRWMPPIETVRPRRSGLRIWRSGSSGRNFVWRRSGDCRGCPGLATSGVVGIVAARVLPGVLPSDADFGGDNEFWRGSGRNVAGFDLARRRCGNVVIFGKAWRPCHGGESPPET